MPGFATTFGCLKVGNTITIDKAAIREDIEHFYINLYQG